MPGQWNVLTLIGLAILTLCEFGAIALADAEASDPGVARLGMGYGVSSVIIGIGLIVSGTSIMRRNVWTGWARYIVLVTGIAQFVVVMPGVMGPMVAGRLALVFWMLLWTLIGVALIKQPAKGRYQHGFCGPARRRRIVRPGRPGCAGAMAALSGQDSTVTWMGTFGWIIVPGTLAGVLLGWAEHLRCSGSGPRRRWLFLSPALFASVLLLNPAGLIQFLQDGLGGGALAIPLFGMLGGYAWSQRGPLWTRMICRFILLAPIPVGLALVVINAPVSPVSVWIGIYFYSFIMVPGIACAIPLADAASSDMVQDG